MTPPFTQRAGGRDWQGGLLLGRRPPDSHGAFGYGRAERTPEMAGSLITYGGKAPLLTIAPTDAGKTSGPVVSNARTYPGPLICLDVKGEVYRLSADHRRRMGQKVEVLDLRDGKPSGSLNPLDMAQLLGNDRCVISRSLAAEIVARPGHAARDFFWIDWSETMLTAGISWLLHHQEDDARLSKLFDLYMSSDSTYNIAVLLDTVRPMNRASQANWSAYLALSDRETRPSVLGSVNAYLRLFESELIRRLTDTTSVDLEAILTGEPVSLYIIVPPYRIGGFAPILRLWLTGLMNLLTMRETVPEWPTLMMVDEAAQLGRVDSFVTASTLMRGYGLKLWTFWQSASQLEIYGSDGRTLIDNAGVVQVFGVRNYRAAAEAAALLGGLSAEQILAMGREEQLLMIEGGAPQRCRQIRYYSDELLVGRNPPRPA
ncbi:MAG: hypothetical protein BGO51_24390 [Rhodospirillales bacterium 69-11]|jgi:type IV secretion system protein VirD4|nr:type IV secretory system conjugative DNA transfer family protein [Rhodospirillales bacterium]OJW33050.1 MAG: hypothetical protein BGO51_24390 [Rhodospirillales bacterium 69-11]